MKRYAANTAIRRRLLSKLWEATYEESKAIERALDVAHDLADKL